jgi:putative acetyltransferase
VSSWPSTCSSCANQPHCVCQNSGIPSGRNIEIRRVSLQSEDASIATAQALIEEYSDAFHVVVRDSPQDIAKYLDIPGGGLWVAYSDGEPAGCIALKRISGKPTAGEIKRLYVQESFRGKGIAHKLLEELETCAAQIGFAWLYLDTNEDFSSAILFYERSGYHRCLRYNFNPQATIFMRKLIATAPAQIRTFEDRDDAAFRDLNEQWITELFAIEPEDRKLLDDPREQILGTGGVIYVADLAGETIGCCALLPLGGAKFEVIKMAVAPDVRNRGIGKLLLQHTVENAPQIGARRLIIETNSKLKNAIRVYESCGFRHVPPEQLPPSAYTRADVFMELTLPAPARE